MKDCNDIIGAKFGLLTVVEYVGEKTITCGSKRKLYRCLCECGNERIVERGLLFNKRIFHCGRKFHPTTKHGLHGIRLYGIWKTMKTRCFNHNCEKYKNYGARGITVCNEWRNDFKKFYDWAMSNGYEENLTIERIDVNGNYCPENCTWIPACKQAKNKTNSICNKKE